jgi:hypothetical protein
MRQSPIWRALLPRAEPSFDEGNLTGIAYHLVKHGDGLPDGGKFLPGIEAGAAIWHKRLEKQGFYLRLPTCLIAQEGTRARGGPKKCRPEETFCSAP